MENWLDFTKLEKKAQSSAMISLLCLEARNLATTVPCEERVSEQGAKIILKKLEDSYQISDEYEQYIKLKDMNIFKMGEKFTEAAISGFLARAQKFRNNRIDLLDFLLTFLCCLILLT